MSDDVWPQTISLDKDLDQVSCPRFDHERVQTVISDAQQRNLISPGSFNYEAEVLSIAVFYAHVFTRVKAKLQKPGNAVVWNNNLCIWCSIDLHSILWQLSWLRNSAGKFPGGTRLESVDTPGVHFCFFLSRPFLVCCSEELLSAAGEKYCQKNIHCVFGFIQK